ncbi:MAG TPA: NAD-dependent epimerase/dehydratase family protein [Vicinamibacterales bacterium]|nr:NAD-dependent epimerase/dehydratase family protein [Vicinamibacterales bacterium]
MRVLITGGAGFIGSHLSDRLLEAGHRVTAVDDLSTGRLANIAHLEGAPGFQFVHESIMHEAVMDRLVSDCDVIYHLASAVGVELIVSRPVEVIERCILGTEIVLRTAHRYKKKVLITSTSEIYGKNGRVPFAEEDDRLLGPTTKSRWSYSCAKAIDEFLALAYQKEKQLPIVIVRLFNTVGPRQSGQYGMVVPRFVQQALAGRPLTVYGDGSQRRCFGYVGDIVGALVALMGHPAAVGQIFNIGNTEEVSILELARRVIRLTGSTSTVELVPYDVAYEAGFEDMARRIPDLTRIQTLIGYQPTVSLDETILRIASHFQESMSAEEAVVHGQA